MVARTADGLTGFAYENSLVRRTTGWTGDFTPTPGIDGQRTRRLNVLAGQFLEPGVLSRRTRRLNTLEGQFYGPELHAWGVPIPTGSFTPVKVTVRDKDGNLLPDIEWIMSAGIFPTASRVDSNAQARLWLLKVDYEEFMAVAPRGEPKGMDYTWYSTAERQQPITPASQLEADIFVDPVELSGLLAGSSGIDFGGMFG